MRRGKTRTLAVMIGSRRIFAALLAWAVLGSTAQADPFAHSSPFSQAPSSIPGSPRIELRLHFGNGMKPAWSLNGVPLSDKPEGMKMSCPPPPDHAACQRSQLLIFGLGTLLLIAVVGR